MLTFSYNSNGLRDLPLDQAIGAVADAGYDGIELSLHPAHLDPGALTPQDAERVARWLDRAGLEAGCLATGADNLLGPERFEPSLIHPTAEGRDARVRLLCEAARSASWLGVPVINFASGIRKEEVAQDKAHRLLEEGIARCLEGTADDVVLAIEPEPGFLIERNDEALALIDAVGSPRLRLSQDLGHTNVVDDDYLAAVERGLPATSHIQVEDIKDRHHVHRIPGDGDIDFTAFAGLLLAFGYDGHVSVELYNHGDRYREALDRSLAHLRASVDAARRVRT